MISRFFRLLNRPLAMLLALLLMVPAAFASPPAKAPARTPAPAAATVAEPVLYDHQHDTLSIQAQDLSLSDILLRVSRQTGMDVRVDPKVERKVSMSLKPLPLEASLDRLLAHLSVLKEYQSDGKGKSPKDVLVGITVLPEGQLDASSAQRLMDRDAELAYRAGVMSQYEKRAKERGDIQKDAMINRWKTRTKKLSAADKARYEKLKAEMDKRTAEQEKRQAEQDAKRVEMDKQRIERLKQIPGGEARLAKKPDPELAAKARQQFAQPVSEPIVPAKKN